MEEMYWWIIGLAYLITCICISIEADTRRHNGTTVFFFCLFCTPLIGAIMYSNYKEIKREEVVEHKEEEVKSN